MYRKTLILSALASFLLISLVFLFLFRGVNRDLEEAKRQNDKFLIFTVSNSIQGIRNEVLYLFDSFSGRVQDLNGKGWDGDLDSLPRDEEYQIENFPSLVKRIDYMEKGSIDEMFLLKGLFGNVEELYGEIISRLTDPPQAEFPAIIHIFDFYGYMVFPVTRDPAEKYSGFLVVFLDIRPAVEQFFMERLKAELPDTRGGFLGRSTVSYTISQKEGRDLSREDLEYNWVFDLSRNFNLFRVRDYYYNRTDQFLSLPVVDSLTDNHLYLTLSRDSGNRAVGDRAGRIRTYLLLLLLYLFLMGSLLLFLYSVYRIQENYRRERQFTSLISHELKTPLSVIKLAAENLSGGYVRGESDVVEYGTLIGDESGRLGRMIENILLLSTLSWAKEGEERTPAGEVAENLLRKNRTLTRDQGVVLTGEIRSGEGFLCGGASLLEAALNNLIHNAVVYGASRSEDRRVILRLENQKRKRTEGVLFSVIDHGPGIGWSDSQRIFEDFTRGRDAREKQLPGSGIGLSLSRRIAESLGGTLNLVRSLKRETVFELWVPAGRENEENSHDRG